MAASGTWGDPACVQPGNGMLLASAGRYHHAGMQCQGLHCASPVGRHVVAPLSQRDHVMLLPEASPAGMQALKGQTVRRVVADPQARAMDTSQPQRADPQVGQSNLLPCMLRYPAPMN